MTNNRLNVDGTSYNNIVEVTNNTAKQSEKQAEFYAQKAEKSLLECLSCKSIVQSVLEACNQVKENIENLFYTDLSEHKDDYTNPHHVTAQQVDAYTKSQIDTLLSAKQPVGNYLTEHQDISGKQDVLTFSTGLTNTSDTITVTDYNKLVKNAAVGTGSVIVGADDEGEQEYSVGIGYDVDVNSGSFSVGIGAEAETSDYSVALGYNAYANNNSIQLGMGSCSGEYSFGVGFGRNIHYNDNQILEYTLLDGLTGLIPDARLSSNIARTSAIPTVPTTLSSFTDDLGTNPTHSHSQYLTSHQDISGKEDTSNKVTSLSSSSTDTQYPSAKCVYDELVDKADISSLSTVATSGSYNDLTNKPTIPAAQVQANWNETSSSSKAYIQNKPSLSTVATSGSYNDLTNKPTIPAAQVQANWNETNTNSKAYIQNKPTIPTVPTNVSAFTNDAGYLTQHQSLSGYQTTSNLVTSVSSSSTDSQYPSAKLFYDTVGNIETLLSQV